MNVTTIIIWAAILVIGVIASIAVKRHYKDEKLESNEKSKISTESLGGLFSSGRKILSNNDSKPTLNKADQTYSEPEYEAYHSEEVQDYIEPEYNAYTSEDVQSYSEPEYETYASEEAQSSNYQNIEYESQNQVLINYENEVKKFQEPMTQNQIDIMTSNNDPNNEKHELKDLFTIDELIKESKRKDSEREKESQRINTEPEDTTELKESIIKKQEAESEDELIEKILADEEIGELLNDEKSSPETIQDIIDSTETKEETIQDIIDSAEAKADAAEEAKEETIQDIIDSAETKEETVQEVLDAEVPKEETIQDIIDSTEEEASSDESEVIEPATQKEIAEAINTASQEIEEEKEEEIGFSESDGITESLLSSEEEEEIKQPTLKSPTKIDESRTEEDETPIDDSSMFTPKQEENDLDYRKDLAKITNTIRGSRLFQDVKEKIRPSAEPEVDPIADLEESYIRTVNDYEDEYEPIINETHDDVFGEVFEPEYNEDAIREENTRRLFNNVNQAPEPEIAEPIIPETRIAEPKIETIKPKPARDNIKIKMGNADLVLKKGDEIIFKHDGETYSSQVYAINGDDISVRYRRKDIIIKPEDVKKIY